MTVRVLRVVEYYYDNIESADDDMTRWAVPATGSHRFNSRCLIRSVASPPTPVSEEPATQRLVAEVRRIAAASDTQLEVITAAELHATLTAYSEAVQT